MTLRLVIVLTVLAHVAFVGSRVTVSLYAISLGASPLTVGVLMSLNGLAVLIFGIMPEPLMALCLYSIQVSL